MSVLRPKPPEDPLRIESTGSRVGGDELGRAMEQLKAIPRESIAAGLRPGLLLSDYQRDRPASELFRALTTARGLRDEVDLVIVACDEPVGQAIRGVFASCCHPFHNHLSRGERGGRPRLFFDVGPPDPDRTLGLLDLVLASRGDDLLERCGLISLVPAAATAGDGRLPGRCGCLAEAMAVRLAGDPALLPRRQLRLDVAQDPAEAIFAPALLVPAAIAGIDVVQLLAGGRAMQQRFLEAPATENPPLLLAAAVLAAGRTMPSASLLFDMQEAPAADGLAAWWRQGIMPTITACGGTMVPADQAVYRGCRLRILQPRRAGRSMVESPSSLASWPANRAAALTVELPRLDEHAVGQLLAMQLLASGLLAASLASESRPCT